MKKVILFSGIFISALLLVASCSTMHRLKPPRVASDVTLDYPLSAQLKKLEGEVHIAVFVSPTGTVEESNLMQSSGYNELDEAALKFAKEVKFEPGTLDEKPVGAWTKLLLRYNLTEVVFDKNRWLSEVRRFLEETVKSDSLRREMALRRLYIQYIGMMNYADNITDISINSLIRSVIAKESEQRWSPFWNTYAAPFVLFDDFLLRFPQSGLTEQAQKDLLRQLLDMEFKIRIRSLKVSGPSRKTIELVDLLEARVKSLQTNL